jgi:hypothetical protein
MKTQHFNFKHHAPAIAENVCLLEYWTEDGATYIKTIDAEEHEKTEKLADTEIRIKEAFTLFLNGEETKIYGSFIIGRSGNLTAVSCPMLMLTNSKPETKRYEEAGGVIGAGDTGYNCRAIFYTIKTAVKLGFIPFQHRKNLSDNFEHEIDVADCTSYHDFRKKGKPLTRYYTTRYGTFVTEIDEDGSERKKKISTAQIIIDAENTSRKKGWVGLDVTDEFGNHDYVKVNAHSLLDLPAINKANEHFRRATATSTYHCGLSVFLAAGMIDESRDGPGFSRLVSEYSHFTGMEHISQMSQF